MDPISAMASMSSLFGMGMQIMGMNKAKSASNQLASEQIGMLGQEMNENAVRQEAMHNNAQRTLVQNIRNTQRARAMGIAGSTTQGAQFGSGTGGGQGQAAAQGASNNMGVTSNLDVGDKIFGIDRSIDFSKMAMASTQTQLNNAQGMMSMGASISQSSGKLANIAGSVGGAIGSGLNNMFAPNLGFS